VKNRETREGDTEALATLMTELGYPSTVGRMSQRSGVNLRELR
jgi:hypothetical protein